MEWGMLKYKDELDFASNVTAHSVAKTTFLDFDSLLDLQRPVSTDLKPYFQAAIEEVEDEAQRITFLAKYLTAIVQIPEMKGQLLRMIGEELEQGGIPESLWKVASLNDRVGN